MFDNSVYAVNGRPFGPTRADLWVARTQSIRRPPRGLCGQIGRDSADVVGVLDTSANAGQDDTMMSDDQEHTTQADQADVITRYVTLLADRTMEQQAIDALVQIGAPAVPALMVAIRERDRWYPAATALARIGAPAIPPLIDLLQHAPFGNFAFHALTAMGMLAAPGFISALAHPHAEVRMWAATAFIYLPDVRARDPLLVTLADPDWMVRESSARALGKLGDVTVRTQLLSMQQHDPDQQVRSAAAEALTVLEQSHSS